MERTRQQRALDLRIAAAQLASHHDDAPAETCIWPRPDEARFRTQSYLASFTKGLPHNIHSGLLQNPRDYEAFCSAINDGHDSDVAATGFAPQWHADSTVRADRVHKVRVRHWDGIHAGSKFHLFGPDAQALTIAPAPTLGSAALTAEMGELYAMALLRDFPLRAGTQSVSAAQHALFPVMRQKLARLARPQTTDSTQDDSTTKQSGLLLALKRQSLLNESLSHEPSQVPPPESGLYLSQFLLCGTADVLTADVAANGIIVFGDQLIDQRVHHVVRKDYATTWNEWLDLQHGAELHELNPPTSSASGDHNRRFIATPRDLASRAHHATPQQLFFNASLMLAAKLERDELQHGEFAGQSLLLLLAQAASCAIAAARFQQFHVHRRLRPEALAARLEKFDHPDVTTPALSAMVADYVAAQLFDDGGKLPARANRLLPLAWIEGSPMAPSYCSAYAAAAGACATVIKAVFDRHCVIDLSGHGADVALQPSDDGRQLLPVSLQQPLTLAAEIDKLAANLAIGRCWAGVSFYSDAAAGLCLGEHVALCLLDEMQLLRNK